MQDSYFLKTGTAGGTLTIILAQIHTGDLVKTALLAAVGAVVSVTVSYVLKRIFGKNRTLDE